MMPMIRGSTKIAAVLGWPVTHSRSPEMLNAAFAAAQLDTIMIPIGVAPADLPRVVAALRAIGCAGASVTMPHKLAIAPLCDELSDAARAIGAVNCLQFGQTLVGHNTDGEGFVDALAATGFDPRGKRAVLLGAGGAARAVAYGLLRRARAVEVIARDPARASWATAWPWTAEHLRDAFARADLVVDCTPIALDHAAEPAAVDALPLDATRADTVIASLVYHRLPLLLARARAAGRPILDGRAMLVGQGARAFTLWTGAPAPVEAMRAALEAALTEPPLRSQGAATDRASSG
jgi:shikimate dehydrogenase